jgi:antitoxin CcdA
MGVSVASGDFPMNAHTRKPTNLSLDAALLAEAKELKVNLSRAAEEGVRRAVSAAKSEHWKAENAAALRSSNAYVEKHGLPLDSFRQF